MRILIEEYPYNAADVHDVLQGIDALENVSGKVSLHYVGYFFFVLKNIHAGHNKINWTRTISTTPAIVQDDATVYLNPVNKKRKINFDEELLIIFFSILNYIGDSKYYKMGNELGKESVFKQYTYARNVIQWNLDIFNSGRTPLSGIKLRDEETEGYNISLALDNNEKQKADNDRLLAELSKCFYVQPCVLGEHFSA